LGCLALTYHPRFELVKNGSVKTLTSKKTVLKSRSDYVFGFNGKMKDNEMKGIGNSYDFGERGYDPRTARFYSIDPLYRQFPSWSPYVFAFDNPIINIDRDGLWGQDARGQFYEQMGTAAVKALQAEGVQNKYKALYVIAQYRNENGFDVTPPNNNPFNIKGQGNAGAAGYMTTEYINGKAVKMQQSFANFSSVEAGFSGYLDLLKTNFPDAYSALSDDTKTIRDFAKGLMNGRLGAYATDPDYESKMTSMLEGVIRDYKKELNGTISKNKKEIGRLQNEMKGADADTQKSYQESINQLKTQNDNLSTEVEQLDKLQ
jgi:RHS repeat-associated protein